jgi:SAM-dependent methyltransferase
MIMTDTDTIAAFDPAVAEAFGGRIMGILGGGLLNLMVDIGHRTGLFTAAAAGWATSDELAARAGLTERYVREWLGAMVTSGIVDYDTAADAYFLRPEHAALLVTPTGVGPLAVTTTVLARHVDQVIAAFRDGGGVPYAAFTPEFTDAWDATGRGHFDAMLIDAYLPLAPGLSEKLAAGARAADFCCGTGHVLVLLATAFPASTFTGYDLDEHAIARARAEAAGAGLANVTFEVADAASVTAGPGLDVAFMVDALHDQVDPDALLDCIRASLAPGGLLFMREPHAADTLAGNLANPMAAIMYSASTLHCLTVSLAHGGAGIGTVFGERHARRLLTDAGFASIEVHPAPAHPFGAVYLARNPG